MSKKKIGTHLQQDRFLKYGNHLFKCYPFLGLFATSYNIGGFVVLKSLIIEHGQAFSLTSLGSLLSKPGHGFIVELDENGQIIKSLHDPTGKVVPDASEVHDEGDTLWLGSFKAKYIAKLELNN